MERTLRYGPISVSGYQVKQDIAFANVPTPKVDGFITAMEVDIVDGYGTKVPIDRLMLHHVVFSNLGHALNPRRDSTCDRFTALDSRTELPAIADRLSVPSGSTLRWRFQGRQLHNVTLANGPRGFSSPHLDRNRAYKVRLRTPGRYQLFCGLHPVDMTQEIFVRRSRR